MCQSLAGLGCCLDTKPCAYNKIFISGFEPIILLGFFSTVLYWECEAPCPTYSTLDGAVWVSGAALKRELRSFGDSGGDMHSVRDNKEEQWKTKPQQDSQPPANKTVHQGKMFVQILIVYYSPETIFICSPAIHRGMHCLALL